LTLAAGFQSCRLELCAFLKPPGFRKLFGGTFQVSHDESRQSLFEMMSNLTLQFRFLFYQIASMTGQNLKLLLNRIDRLFEQAEAIDGGSEDGERQRGQRRS